MALSPDELLRSCEAITSTKAHGTKANGPNAHGTKATSIEIPAAGLHCWYYMSAIQNMSVLEDQHGERLLGICASPDTTLMDYVRLFVQYARGHKADAQANAAAEAVIGLAAAFPCREGTGQ
jgi:hypothetical protein